MRTFTSPWNILWVWWGYMSILGRPFQLEIWITFTDPCKILGGRWVLWDLMGNLGRHFQIRKADRVVLTICSRPPRPLHHAFFGVSRCSLRTITLLTCCADSHFVTPLFLVTAADIGWWWVSGEQVTWVTRLFVNWQLSWNSGDQSESLDFLLTEQVTQRDPRKAILSALVLSPSHAYITKNI